MAIRIMQLATDFGGQVLESHIWVSRTSMLRLGAI